MSLASMAVCSIHISYSWIGMGFCQIISPTWFVRWSIFCREPFGNIIWLEPVRVKGMFKYWNIALITDHLRQPIWHSAVSLAILTKYKRIENCASTCFAVIRLHLCNSSRLDDFFCTNIVLNLFRNIIRMHRGGIFSLNPTIQTPL